jgi:hypothetical protein
MQDQIKQYMARAINGYCYSYGYLYGYGYGHGYGYGYGCGHGHGLALAMAMPGIDHRAPLMSHDPAQASHPAKVRYAGSDQAIYG